MCRLCCVAVVAPYLLYGISSVEVASWFLVSPTGQAAIALYEAAVQLFVAAFEIATFLLIRYVLMILNMN